MPALHLVGLLGAQRLHEFQAQGMANVVWAFAQLLVRHEPFLEAVAAKGLTHGSPQALANTAWAFAQVGLASSPLMDSIQVEVRSRMPEFQLQELANTAWAFASLTFLAVPLAQELAAASLDRLAAASTHGPRADRTAAAASVLEARHAHVRRGVTAPSSRSRSR